MSHRQLVSVFIAGFVAGIFTSLTSVLLHPNRSSLTCLYSQPLSDAINATDTSSNDKTLASEFTGPFDFNDSRFHQDDDTSIADRLLHDVRILCLVMTFPKNHDTKAIHVNATWGRRCNRLLFVTRSNDTRIPTLVVDVEDGRQHLSKKTRAALSRAFTDYLEDYDWFMKADDDTYVIMENLRYFLSEQNQSSAVYFGQKFALHVAQGYPSGGAAYVLSREALRRFGQKNAELCSFSSGAEDISVGQCMEKLGVEFGDTFDALGRTRFHCFNPEAHIMGNYPEWYFTRVKYNGTKAEDRSPSDSAITFHYVSPNAMHTLEYFVYHLRPYGVIKGFQNLNTNFSAT